MSDRIIEGLDPEDIWGLQKIYFYSQTDGHGLKDSAIYKDPEYIYFIGSKNYIVEITNGLTNLYIPVS